MHFSASLRQFEYWNPKIRMQLSKYNILGINKVITGDTKSHVECAHFYIAIILKSKQNIKIHCISFNVNVSYSFEWPYKKLEIKIEITITTN